MIKSGGFHGDLDNSVERLNGNNVYFVESLDNDKIDSGKWACADMSDGNALKAISPRTYLRTISITKSVHLSLLEPKTGTGSPKKT